jgi:hypothetical protein
MSESDEGYNIPKFLAKHDIDPKEFPEVYEAFTKCMAVSEELARVVKPSNYLRSCCYKPYLGLLVDSAKSYG